MDQERRERLLAMQGFVVLGKRKGGNAYSAIIERSFSMDMSPDHASFWWIGTAYDNIVGAKWDLNKARQKANAEKYRDLFNKSNPDIEFEVWDVRDPNLPIVLDWEKWVLANEPSDKTLSGVRDKYGARNMTFTMKADDTAGRAT